MSGWCISAPPWSSGSAVACFVTAAAVGPLTLLLAFYALRLTGQGLMIHVEATATARAFQSDPARPRARHHRTRHAAVGDGISAARRSPASPRIGWRSTYALLGAVALLRASSP